MIATTPRRSTTTRTTLVALGPISGLTRSSAIAGDRATRKHSKDCWNGRDNDNLGWNDLQMDFKVIKSGTNRKRVYDFLLVVYRNYPYRTPFLRNLMWNNPITLKYAHGHWLSYHLTAVVWPYVCKIFGRQWRNETKIAIFNDPTLIWRPLSSEPPRISA